MTTFFAEILERDAAMILEDPLGPAEDVVLISQDGGRYPLRALFEDPAVDVAPGSSHAPVLSEAPVLHVLASRITAAIGRPLTARDGFIARGKQYRVQRPADDGYGMIACKLLEDGDD